MTDLVKKIADAVWARITLPDVYEKADIQEAIRQALADAGGAVAWQLRLPNGSWSQPTANEVTVEVARENKVEVRPLYTRPTPDSGLAAELEAQAADWERLYNNMAARCSEAEALLAKSREREGRMREALTDLIGAVRHLKPCPATLEKAEALSADKENKND